MRADGSELPVELSITKVALPGPPVFTVCLWDLTGRKQARAEQQARASGCANPSGCKAWAAGRSVAHDFNNLLWVTLYYAASVVQRAADDRAASADAERIRAAAEQGAVQPAGADRAFHGADRRSAG